MSPFCSGVLSFCMLILEVDCPKIEGPLREGDATFVWCP